MIGGDQASPSGRTWRKQNRYFRVTGSRGYQQILGSTIYGYRRPAKNKRRWRRMQVLRHFAIGIIGGVTESASLNGHLRKCATAANPNSPSALLGRTSLGLASGMGIQRQCSLNRPILAVLMKKRISDGRRRPLR